MKYIKYFNESISSDLRSFKNWSQQRSIDFDQDLFDKFIKHKQKLSDKNIFNYHDKDHLNKEIFNVSKNISIKQFEKDIRNWDKLDINYDLLYKDNNILILHTKDFKSTQKLSSGCNLCTNSETMYNNYIKFSNAYFFDILDFKNNRRFFGTFKEKSLSYDIVDEKDRYILIKEWIPFYNEYRIDNYHSDKNFIKDYDEIINICDNFIKNKINTKE